MRKKKTEKIDISAEQFARLIDSICGEMQFKEFMRIFRGEKKCQSKK